MMRIGLVGCGHIGTVHAYVLQQLTEAKLVDAALTATFDADPERARRGSRGTTAASPRRRSPSSWPASTSCGSAPGPRRTSKRSSSRSTPGCRCSARSRSAPTSPRPSASRRCSSGCRTRSAWCCAGRRCSASAAEIIASGEYGRPLATILRDDQYFPIQGFYGSTWRKDVAHAGGGTLIEHSIHDVDVLHWLLGDPVSVERAHGVTVRSSGHRGHRGGHLRATTTARSRS